MDSNVGENARSVIWPQITRIVAISRIGADEFAEVQAEADRNASPGTVGNRALVVAMDARRGLVTLGTGRCWAGGMKGQDNGGRIGVKVVKLQLGRTGEQNIGKHGSILHILMLIG